MDAGEADEQPAVAPLDPVDAGEQQPATGRVARGRPAGSSERRAVDPALRTRYRTEDGAAATGSQRLASVSTPASDCIHAVSCSVS